MIAGSVDDFIARPDGDEGRRVGAAQHALLAKLAPPAVHFASGDACAAASNAKASGEVSLGTTIIACVFEGGVVLGADSRTTTGSYIANRVSDKLTPVLPPRIWCCRSGSAADTQAISDIVKYQLSLLDLNHPSSGDRETTTVEEAAKLFRALGYKYREQLQAGIILAGVDPDGTPHVWNMPLGGSLHQAPFAIGGSGSSYIYGFCDVNFRPGMTRQECERFVVTALALAMSRDGSSGGVARLVTLHRSAQGEFAAERQVFSGAQLPSFYQD